MELHVMAPRLSSTYTLVFLAVTTAGCDHSTPAPAAESDLSGVRAQIEEMVERFHSADTARDAEAVIALLWPEYEMMVDGAPMSYAQIAGGSREFMAGLETFHTTWTDLNIIPLTDDLAISYFRFRDSIVTNSGDAIRNEGPTSLLWERRDGEWRLRFGDADHYPLTR